ncbi:MAG: prolyl oligopeptidase family serine peptidase [Lentisphaeria bacterium]|nr:prolyl oligopeptidase family serine peptidase [Lentisphaeria bacterium]
MAHIQCNYWSEVLGRRCDMTVLLPQRPPRASGRRSYPVVYLLHGLCGDHRTWLANTALEHLTQNLNLAVVMPDGERGFFTDMAHGPRYGEFFSRELPGIAASLFPVSTRREECFVAGASMGGYGALRLALGAPERFGAVFAMSPLVDLARAITHGNSAIGAEEMRDVFGDPAEQTARGNDLFDLARKAREFATPPRVAVYCRTEDLLYQDSVMLCRHLESLNWPELEYSLDMPGRHDWSSWSAELQPMLNFFRKP